MRRRPPPPARRRASARHGGRLLAVAAVAAVAALAAGVAVGSGDSPSVHRRGARVLRLTIDSDAVGRRLPVRIVVPAGDARKRPLLVFLHGKGVSVDGYLKDPFFAGLAALGARAPIVAFPSGADHSYWHDRRDGAWGRYVVDEVIPRVVERSGADGSRVAIGGISMGGFGAFDLARLHPGRFCAVGGHSPALWTSARQTAPGAFDGAADFRRHDVIAGASRLKDEKLWIDAGDADPFQPGDRAFVAALRRHRIAITVHTWSGGHEGAYWNRHFASYLRFYARRLAACAG